MALSRLIARPLLATYFVANGANDITNAPALAAQAAPVTGKIAPMVENAAPGSVSVPQDPVLWVRAAGAVQVAAGLALALGKMPRLSAAVLGATLIPSTAARYRFWEASDKTERAEQMNHFVKNAALGGGLLIAALDTEGKPGLAWRAARAGKDARREAKHLARSARREAKLMKAELG
ncbi:DoxX family membrane protein [Nocardioides sp. SYSU DS0651]|uniref:DoxX family membrane protein n=1 Tax=Nocardioides sp. SYSU DS0651 TaxID=3415955 RepID=UPI003F4C7A6B